MKYNKAHTKTKATKLEKYVTNINDKVILSKIQRIDKNIEGRSIFLGKCSKKMNKKTDGKL